MMNWMKKRREQRMNALVDEAIERSLAQLTEGLAKHIDHDALAKKVGVDYHVLASDIADKVDLKEVARLVAPEVDSSDVAGQIDTDDLASDVAYHMSAEDVASYFDADDVARELDMRELVRNIDIDMGDLAGRIDMKDLAECFDMRALSNAVTDRIDTATIAAQFDLKELAECIDADIWAVGKKADDNEARIAILLRCFDSIELAVTEMRLGIETGLSIEEE